MEAFFLSVTTLVALSVLATAVCVALRFGITPRVAQSSGGSEEFTQPRRSISAGTLVVGLLFLFTVTLLFAMLSR